MKNFSDAMHFMIDVDAHVIVGSLGSDVSKSTFMVNESTFYIIGSKTNMKMLPELVNESYY